MLRPLTTEYNRKMYDLCFATITYNCAAVHANQETAKNWKYATKLMFNTQLNECTRMYTQHVKHGYALNLVPFYKLLEFIGGDTAVHRACRLRETLFQYEIDYVDFLTIAGGDEVYNVVMGDKLIHELVVYFSCCRRVNVDAKYVKHLDQMPVDNVYKHIRNGFNEVVNFVSSGLVWFFSCINDVYNTTRSK